MMASPDTTKSRERLRPKGRSLLGLITLASWLFGFGAGAWAMLDSMNPSSDLRTPYWVDLSDIPEGGRKTIYWGHWPIYIAHRSPEEIAAARKWDEDNAGWRYYPFGERDEERVQRDQWIVVIGRDFIHDCYLAGQQPTENRGKWGGWYSPCSGLTIPRVVRVDGGMNSTFGFRPTVSPATLRSPSPITANRTSAPW